MLIENESFCLCNFPKFSRLTYRNCCFSYLYANIAMSWLHVFYFAMIVKLSLNIAGLTASGFAEIVEEMLFVNSRS